MSAYTEQEELERLKEWWKNYGGSLLAGVALGLAILFGYRYWTQHQETQRVEASAIYDQMLQQLRANKVEASASGEKLINEYASTPYAGMAALLLARQAHEAGDLALARQRLEWALENSSDATEHSARLRLARLLLNAGELTAVAPLVAIDDIAGFEAEYHELRGDLALAQGLRDAARSAYAEAMTHLAPNSPYRSVLSMKLDDLGAEK